MDDHKTRTLSRSPTRKHLQSTFPSMMVDYMSGEELSKHLGKQMSIHNEKYKEPEHEDEHDEAKEKKKLRRKNSKLKKQQSRHGMILQGSDPKLSESAVAITRQSEEEDLPDDEEQENIRKMKEKAHDELVQGLLLLRDFYKAEYKKALQDKVHHQRRNLQQRQSKLEEETKMSEQDQQEMQHKVAHKLPKSILVNDVQFKNGLQTDYYKIISLENQLKKEGFLNKSHEIKEFWDFITVPENLAEVLEDGLLSWERIKTYHKEHNKASLATQGEIDATAQQPKPQRKKKLKGVSSWRSTTHGIRTILTPSTPRSEIASGGRKSSSYVSSGRYRAKKTPPSTAIPIEQRFPKVEFPPLAAYRLEFGEPEPDPEEVRKQDEAYKRLQARNGLKRTLNTMFSHALANRAATQRLIDKNEDYNFESLSGASNLDEFHDLASVQLKPSGSANKKQQSRISSTKSKDGKSRVGSHRSASRRTKIPELAESLDRSDSSMSLSSKEDCSLVVELPPLTLNQLSTDCITKDAKCLSTFWVNPMAKRDLNSYEDWNSGIVS